MKAFVESDNGKLALAFSRDMQKTDDTQDIDVILVLAECNYLFGEKIEALKHVDSVLEREPHNTAGLFLKGKLQSSLSEKNQALECFLKCSKEIIK